MELQLTTVHEEQKSTLLVPSRPDSDAQLVSTYASRRMGDPNDLVALAQYVQTADDFTRATVGSKLDLISQQIKFLQEQARQILDEAKRDVDLSHARCNFKRIPNKVYHLYERQVQEAGEETRYFSMLSPQEWGGRLKDRFIASYRLEADMSWTPLERVAERDERYRFNPELLGIDRAKTAGLAIALS
jgi:hypothetical protein